MTPSSTPNRDVRQTSSLSLRAVGDRPRAASAGSTLNNPGHPSLIQNRTASAGAIWNVGGGLANPPTSPIRAVYDGRGGLIRSGTNAPMYSSSFTDTSVVDDDNDDPLEGRLAAALEFDQTNRLLNIPITPGRTRMSTSIPYGLKRQTAFPEVRTKWVNGEWTRAGSLLGECWLALISSMV